MTDHKETALELLGSIRLDTGDLYDQSPSARKLRVELAQVHVTLALVEQQRIANLIALGQAWIPPLASLDGTDPRPGHYREDVREGLGL